jgi:hypothetical protein
MSMSANAVSGGRLLATDLRIATLFLREGRDRVCARLFGVSSDDSGIVTLIALAALGHAVHVKLHDVITAPKAPSATDTLIGAGMLKEVVHAIAGDWSREEPIVPALIVAALIAHQVRPWARVSLHDIRAASHRLLGDFDRRYGHHLRANGQRVLGGTANRLSGGRPGVDLEAPNRTGQ